MVQVYLELEINDILPHDIRAGELAQIITSLEDLILEIVKIKNPSITKEILGIGIYKLENNSIDIDVISKVPEVADPAYMLLTNVINSQKFLTLPNKALDHLREIHRITSSYERDANFYVHNGSIKQQASLHQEMIIPAHKNIQTNTTIFGKVIRVGGSTPHVALELSSGKKIYCSVKSEGIAKELGNRLYEWVGVIGHASINPDDLSIDKFHVERMTEYTGELNLVETINELKNAVGNYFSDIDDVDNFVNSLRS